MKNILLKLEDNPVFLIFSINLLFVIVLYSFNIPFNETNDDTGMAAILSGQYGYNEPRMIFSNVIYAFILKLLYSITLSLNWYSVMQLIITFVSFTIVGIIVIRNMGIKLGCLVYIIFLRIFFGDFFLLYQFTRVSMLCCISGLMLLIDSLQKKDKNIIAFSFFWTLLGSLIRYKSLIAVLPIAGVYGLFKILLHKELYCGGLNFFYKNIKPFVIAFVLFFTTVIITVALDNSYYKNDPKWKEYKEYNRIRADLFDYGWPAFLPSYDDHAHAYESMGISENDLKFYSIGILSDEKNLPVEKLEKLLDFKLANTYRNYNLFAMLKSFFQYSKEHAILELLLVGSFIGSCYARKSKDMLFALFNLSGLIIMYYYLFSVNRIVDRAYAPIILATFIALICYYDKDSLKIKKISNKEFIIAIVGVIILFSRPISKAYSEEKQENNDWQMDPLIEMIDKNHESIYVADRRVFDVNYKYYSAFHTYPNNFFDRQINIGGWLSRSPIMEYNENRLGVQNFYEELLTKDNMVFYTIKNDFILETYLKEHYDDCATASIVDEANGSKLIKFIKFSNRKELKDSIDNENMYIDNIGISERYSGYTEINLSIKGIDYNADTQLYLEIPFSDHTKTYYFNQIKEDDDGIIKCRAFIHLSDLEYQELVDEQKIKVLINK